MERAAWGLASSNGQSVKITLGFEPSSTRTLARTSMGFPASSGRQPYKHQENDRFMGSSFPQARLRIESALRDFSTRTLETIPAVFDLGTIGVPKKKKTKNPPPCHGADGPRP